MNEIILKMTIILCGLLFTLESCDNKLTILAEDTSIIYVLGSLSGQYEEEHGVRIAIRPNTFEDLITKANRDFLSQTGQYDIVLQYNFALPTYVQEDYVLKLDTLLQQADNIDTAFVRDLFPMAWKEVGWYYKNPSVNSTAEADIQPIGFPFQTNTKLLVYNKRMFDDPKNKAGFKKKYGRELSVPTDWIMFKQIAEFFTTKDTYGVCMQGYSDGIYYEYCDFLYGMGGSVFDKKYGWQGDKDNKLTFNTKTAEEATDYYLSLKPFNKGNYYTVDAREQVRLILEDDVAMAFVWSDYLYEIVSSYHSSHFGYAPLPGKHSPITGSCLFVNRNSKKSKEAIDYILHLMKPEVQVFLTLRGFCSPLCSIYDNEEVKKRIPYAQALQESLRRGNYMYEAGLEAEMVSNIIAFNILKLWSNKNPDVKSALHEIETSIESARQKAYRCNE